MNKKLIRTQILLPQDLREKIEQARHNTKESLGAYLRRAATERLMKECKTKQDLGLLANEVVGNAKNPRWTKEKAIEWQRKMREDQDQ
ncbi:MAG: hypothetical protein HYV77_04200 [Candidatus Wildermuthbacteria bacterium]|nr:hypothetical protein [Candidatus Wildermuthbacteria bacterium]